ncbi:hypothetical protein C8Q76DRAFT_793807 [Earliella scabrosa]|nr:hypothetical protein C8Q76DRAFT_793807 [Earliella scabrosa]
MPAGIVCLHCGDLFTAQGKLARHIGNTPACRTYYDTLSSERAVADENPAQSLSEPADQRVEDIEQTYPHIPVEHPSLTNLHAPPSPPLAPQSKRPRVTVEEVCDEDEEDQRWVHEVFPGRAGESLGLASTYFEAHRAAQQARNEHPHTPFADEDEWGLVQWLTTRTTQTGVDEWCKLPITRKRTKPSFKNKVAGPNGQFLTEELEIWRRCPVGLSRELIGNAGFHGHVSYRPVRVTKGGVRYYGEMNTGDWWWDIQGKLPPEATVAPLLIASDKTQLTVLRGDKSAWPVYLSIGNIDKDVRRKPSRHGALLLGYVPVAKLKCFTKDQRSDASYRLFHTCIAKMLEPLIEAGKTGVRMVCADGHIRLVFPILASYIADHPEQCLVACCKENRCPRCTVPRKERGDLDEHPLRSQTATADILRRTAEGESLDEYTTQGLRPVGRPFWAELPHTDIFACITPDILHQIHKGVIKDYIIKWAQKLLGKEELDARFAMLSQSHGLRHFGKGISHITQWTGTEAKEIEKVLLGLLVGQTDNDVIRATRALLDFVYYAQYQVHSDTTLQGMKDALVHFHQYKDVFKRLGLRKDFNIPKLHSLLHYIDAICRLGCADGFNTEHSERLHIDFAKKAFRASSRREYVVQMTTWLQRQEAIVRQTAYLDWIERSEGKLQDDEDWAEDELEVGDEDEDVDEAETAGDTSNDVAAPSNTAPGNAPAMDASEGTIEDVKALRELIHSNVARAYQLPLSPTTSRVSALTLSTDYGTAHLIEKLNAFLHTHYPHSTRATLATPFDVYHYIHILLPPNIHVANGKRICKLRASPFVPRLRDRQARPAHFDCGLFAEDRELYRREGGLQGLRAGEVRAIFRLPAGHGYVTEPLMYVRWFRPFRTSDPMTNLPPTAHSTRHHARNIDIVHARDLVRTCHLIPKYSEEDVEPDWTSSTILDQSIPFLFNHYLDFHTFSALS